MFYRGIEPSHERRKGHIPGAVSIPFSEITDNKQLIDRERVAALFATAGIKPDDTRGRLLPRRSAGDGGDLRRAAARTSGPALRRLVPGLGGQRIADRWNSDTRYSDPYLAGVGLGLVLLTATSWSAMASAPREGSRRWSPPAPRSAVGTARRPASPALAPYLAQGLASPLARLVRARTRRRRRSAASARRGWRDALGGLTAHGPRIGGGQRIYAAVAGGVLMGFGAKLARGCTSGQALTGGALLAAGSWIFIVTCFAVRLSGGAAGAEALAMTAPFTETGVLGTARRAADRAAHRLRLRLVSRTRRPRSRAEARGPVLPDRSHRLQSDVQRPRHRDAGRILARSVRPAAISIWSICPRRSSLPQAVGGALFGAGFIVGGLCPGHLLRRRRNRPARRRRGDRRHARSASRCSTWCSSGIAGFYTSTALGAVTFTELARRVARRRRRAGHRGGAGRVCRWRRGSNGRAASSHDAGARRAPVGGGVGRPGRRRHRIRLADAETRRPGPEIAAERDHISAPELAERIIAGDPALRVFDLRSAAEFEQMHIPTAQHAIDRDAAARPAAPRRHHRRVFRRRRPCRPGLGAAAAAGTIAASMSCGKGSTSGLRA